MVDVVDVGVVLGDVVVIGNDLVKCVVGIEMGKLDFPGHCSSPKWP